MSLQCWLRADWSSPRPRPIWGTITLDGAAELWQHQLSLKAPEEEEEVGVSLQVVNSGRC